MVAAEYRQIMPMFSRTIAAIHQGIAAGHHSAAQVYVSLRGSVLMDEAFADERAHPFDRDSMLVWMSAGKPLAAVAMGQLVARGLASWDDPVIEYIAEFGQHGKAPIRIRHLLTHTAGFRGPMGSFEPGTWEDQIAKACALRLEPGWIPGQKAGYHPGSSWFILGELLRVIDGRPYDRYVREEIFLPLGQEHAWVGMNLRTYEAYGARLAPTHITDVAARNTVNKLNEPYAVTLPRPGANARGPIRSLGRVYEAVLGWLQAESPMKAIARDLVAHQRTGMMDHTFKCVLDWGLGFMLDSKQYADEHPYGYGKHASPHTFGHSGNQCSCAFADPAHGLVVAWVCNGMPGDPVHDLRQRAINAAIYEDLGLAG